MILTWRQIMISRLFLILFESLEDQIIIIIIIIIMLIIITIIFHDSLYTSLGFIVHNQNYYFLLLLKEGRKYFNYIKYNAFSTFLFTVIWRRTYVKGPLRQRERERGNPLPPLQGPICPISSKSCFYKHHRTDTIAHTTAFVTSVVEHWLEREIATMGGRSDDTSRHERTIYHGATSRYFFERRPYT